MPSHTILHLTNGTSVVSLMRQAGIPGPIVSWDDVLHEGPVPIGLNTAALRERRAQFLASCGWGSAADIGRQLELRDRALDAATGRGNEGSPDAGSKTPVDEIVLWFEHDLYDQLQVLQILHRLPIDGDLRVSAVPDDHYLGHQAAARFPELFAARREVTSSARLAARDAWTAFRSPNPTAIVDVLSRVSDLPHLRAALVRHLEQFPSIMNGLSRTEQQALETISSGISRLREVYTVSHHAREAAIFMGDAAFLVHIESLLLPPRPLLHRIASTDAGSEPTATRSHTSLRLDDSLGLTDDGGRVLEGSLDRVRACGVNRWLGGVELVGHGPVWRWDRARETVRTA